MSVSFDDKWLAEYQKRTGCRVHENGKAALIKEEQPEHRSKYGNEKTIAQGEAFDSRHEAQCYAILKQECRDGIHIGLARQVTFHLPGGVKYIADFVTMEKDGSFKVYDAKSCATARNAVYRIKKKQMAECHGIEIIEV